MAKVTTKLQVTIPKALADEYQISPGDHIEFQAAGPVIRIVPETPRNGQRLSLDERLRLFDAATERARDRAKTLRVARQAPRERDWKREDLYNRGESD